MSSALCFLGSFVEHDNNVVCISISIVKIELKWHFSKCNLTISVAVI